MVVLGLVAIVPASSAFDVTGTWSGKARCKGFADGHKFSQTIEVTAGVSQSGRDVNIEFTGLSFVARASGVAIADAKKADKGELGFVSCDSEPEPIFGVTGRTKITTNPSKGKGTVRGVTIVAGKDIDDLGIVDATFTCTVTLKRSSTIDPAVGDCSTM